MVAFVPATEDDEAYHRELAGCVLSHEILNVADAEAIAARFHSELNCGDNPVCRELGLDLEKGRMRCHSPARG